MTPAFLYFHPYWKFSPTFARILLKSLSTFRILFDGNNFVPPNLFPRKKNKELAVDLSRYVIKLCVYVSVCVYVCVCVCVCVCARWSLNQFSTQSDSPVIWCNESTAANVQKTLQISYEISFGRCNLHNLKERLLSNLAK